MSLRWRGSTTVSPAVIAMKLISALGCPPSSAACVKQPVTC
eukprot:SM000103S09497  [mRNA]  locus=s103:339747:340055:+ [translate_table: standard]